MQSSLRKVGFSKKISALSDYLLPNMLKGRATPLQYDNETQRETLSFRKT